MFSSLSVHISPLIVIPSQAVSPTEQNKNNSPHSVSSVHFLPQKKPVVSIRTLEKHTGHDELPTQCMHDFFGQIPQHNPIIHVCIKFDPSHHWWHSEERWGEVSEGCLVNMNLGTRTHTEHRYDWMSICSNMGICQQNLFDSFTKRHVFIRIRYTTSGYLRLSRGLFFSLGLWGICDLVLGFVEETIKSSRNLSN